MVNKIQFVHQDLIIPVIVIGLSLLSLFLWKERKTTNGKIFVANGIVSFLVIVLIAFLALKPSIITKSKSLEVAVLTSNYKQKTIDSLQKLNKNLVLINYKEGEPILDKNIKPAKVYVLGNGLASYDLWQLKNTAAKYIKGNPIKGITKLNYNSKLFIGENLFVLGKYQHSKKGDKLFLEFPKGTKLDSITFNNKEKQNFQLTTEVKVAGKFLYNLVEKDSLNKIIESNPLPVEVKEKESLKILMLNSFPTFETKYLKNFLAESGHQVIVKNKLTKGKYKYEYFNSAKERVLITTNWLKEIDVLIIDATSFLNLPSRQRSIINNVIKKEGLGVLILPDINFFANKNNKVPFKFLKDKLNYFQLDGIKNSIPKYNYFLKEDNPLGIIHKNGRKTYSAFKYVGKGKITTTVAQLTYQLVLSGHVSSFKKFWTEMLNETSKKKYISGYFNTNIPFSYLNEPFLFELYTNIDNPEVVNKMGNKIPLTQKVNQSDYWSGKIYPKDKGWNHVQIIKDSLASFSFYTFNGEEFTSFKAYKTSIKNSVFFKNNRQLITENNTKKDLNLFLVFIFILFLFGYLWLSPKL